MKSPAQELKDSIAKLIELRQGGFLSPEEYGAALTQKREENASAIKQARESVGVQGGRFSVADFANQFQDSAIRNEDKEHKKKLEALLEQQNILTQQQIALAEKNPMVLSGDS